jgi:hypothetical protein
MKHCPICDIDVPGSIRDHARSAEHQRAEEEQGGFGMPNASTLSRECEYNGRQFGESARKPSLDEYDRRGM